MSAQVKDESNSERQAKAQLESIKEMVERLRHCREFNDTPGHLKDCELDRATILGGVGIYDQGQRIKKAELVQYRMRYHDLEEAEQAISEDPLSVEVRSDWHTPGGDPQDAKPAEYMILLCTGGPAVRITGQLDQWQQPETAKIEHQDWFTPWIELRVDSEDEAAMVEYASRFYFGE
jgi:hypothetical protein